LTRDRNKVTQETQEINQGKRPFNQRAFTDLNNINQEYDSVKNQLIARGPELADRLSKASQASKILETAFLNLKSSIESSGQSVRGFTKTELTKSFEVFKRFTSVGGGTNAGSALNKLGLSGQDFDRLEKFLQSVGDVDLGKGKTGSDLLRDINKAFGAAFLAPARAANTGETIEQATKGINDSLDQAKKNQEAAFKLEEELRDLQLEVAKAQLADAVANKEFVETQKKVFANLDKTLSDTGTLNKVLTKLDSILGKPIPVTFDNTSPSAVQGTGATPSLDKFSESIDSFNGSIQDMIESLQKKIEVENTVSVSPFSVNVAIAAPDFLKLAGPQIAKQVIDQISPAISKAFGSIDKSAQSLYDSSVSET
jgi:flagellar hook-basal body complex protein FliE